jgi:uroporphyrinogen decarboxylase
MNSRQRVLAALNHQEADRIPFDLGGTGATGIHKSAYRQLRRRLGLSDVEIRTEDIIQQLAVVDEDLAELLGTDCRNVAPRSSAIYNLVLRDEGAYHAYTDEWGIDWRMPKEGGFYFDMSRHPLANATSVTATQGYAWPDAADPHRFNGLRQRAREVYLQDKIVVMGGLCAGVTEMHSWLRGYASYYTDFYEQPELSEYLMDCVVDLKIQYWEKALAEAGEYVDVVMEADDMAGQDRLLLSPTLYRRYIKPRHTRLFAQIKSISLKYRPDPVKIFFHSCGAIRPLIPELIEAGIDILNPVQKSAAGMDLVALKRDFGNDIVFWGGGVDTQNIFNCGSPQEVHDDVCRSIDALAPGGGFVFATVHNTQADVPAENFIAMWQALQDSGSYA